MSIAGAIFVIAVGAILRYATNINVQGVDFDTVGLILMIAGGAALVLSFLYEAFWARKDRQDAAIAAEQREAPQQAPVEEEREVRRPPRY